MNMMSVSLTILLLNTAWSAPGDPTSLSDREGTHAPRMVIAQGDVQIPSDVQLERMEDRAITTPPLHVREAPRVGGGEEGEIRRMDERARRIDQQLLGSSAICTDCK